MRSERAMCIRVARLLAPYDCSIAISRLDSSTVPMMKPAATVDYSSVERFEKNRQLLVVLSVGRSSVAVKASAIATDTANSTSSI